MNKGDYVGRYYLIVNDKVEKTFEIVLSDKIEKRDYCYIVKQIFKFFFLHYNKITLNN